LLDRLPRGGMLDEEDWQRRHRLLQRLLLGHLPLLAVVGLLLGRPVGTVALVLVTPGAVVLLGHVWPGRRGRAVSVTAGLVYCSTALTVLSDGTTEAHFHYFIIIGFIALYQDWAPFLCNITLTVLTHGLGSAWSQSLIFDHPSAQQNPWLWSLLHGVAVLAACVGVALFWGVTEDSQNERNALVDRLAEAEVGRRRFTSDLLLNLARRNQAMLYRQLDIINQLEETEQDPDVLAELFRLDHLATRVRRNAESLLVLSGEQPPRVWREPVALRDVVRAAIAETEDLERVAFDVDDVTAVAGRCVTDLTHLLAELTENAVRYSPPESVVTVRARPAAHRPEGYLLTIEDGGVGIPTEELAAANALLADPPEVDLSVSQRLGFHVVARLAARHGVAVTLASTPGAGTTALVHLPVALLEQVRRPAGSVPRQRVGTSEPGSTRVRARTAPGTRALPVGDPGRDGSPGPAPSGAGAGPYGWGGWGGWWEAPDPVDGPPLLVPQQRVVEITDPPRVVEITDPPVGPDPVAGQTVQGLHRRVPQASLAPGLRRPSAPGPVGVPTVQRAAAAGALSRYQAGRRQAQAAAAPDRR